MIEVHRIVLPDVVSSICCVACPGIADVIVPIGIRRRASVPPDVFQKNFLALQETGSIECNHWSDIQSFRRSNK